MCIRVVYPVLDRFNSVAGSGSRIDDLHNFGSLQQVIDSTDERAHIADLSEVHCAVLVLVISISWPDALPLDLLANELDVERSMRVLDG